MPGMVGRYEVLRELGRGGMATVHLARQPELDRLIALKEMTVVHADRDALAKRFVRESRLAGSLSHPSIVTVFDYFEHDGTPFIAMEYVAAGSLRPYVRALGDAQRLFVLASVLEGLIHAEEHGVVHRDLKPENVLVSAGGRIKITDFGVAKATRTVSTALTGVGMTVGTPGYMAPEQAMAQPVGPWTDLYAVGCMAYELFTGRVPFADSEGPMAILMRHVAEPIPPANAANPEVDPAISNWIAALTAREPAARVQSAPQAWESLQAIAVALLGPRWEREARLNQPAPPEPDPAGMPSIVFETYMAPEPGRARDDDAPAPSSPGDGAPPPRAGHAPAPSSPGHAPAPSSPGHAPASSSPGHAPAPSSPGHAPAPSSPGESPPRADHAPAPPSSDRDAPPPLPTQAPQRPLPAPAPAPSRRVPPIALASLVLVALVIVAVLVLVA